jgi:ion channel
MRERRLSRFHATHSYWAVLAAIGVDFVFAALAPDGAWATSVLVLAQTLILVLALWTAGWHVTDSRLALVLVVGGSIAAAANLVSGGRVASGAVGLAAGILTIAIAVVIAAGAIEQGEVNSKSVAGVICVYLLLGLVFTFLYSVLAALGDGAFFAQGTDGTRAIRLYFSFVTLATLGYGDYSPAGDLGHMLAVLEALIGQLYLVTVVAVVVTRIGHPQQT